MDDVTQSLLAVCHGWRVSPTDCARVSVSREASLARDVLRFSSKIISSAISLNIDDELARVYAKTANHICRQRACVFESIEGSKSESNVRTVCVFMYVIECHLRMALAHARLCEAFQDGSRIGRLNARFTECPFYPKTPDAICKAAHASYLQVRHTNLCLRQHVIDIEAG